MIRNSTGLMGRQYKGTTSDGRLENQAMPIVRRIAPVLEETEPGLEAAFDSSRRGDRG